MRKFHKCRRLYKENDGWINCLLNYVFILDICEIYTKKPCVNLGNRVSYEWEEKVSKIKNQ